MKKSAFTMLELIFVIVILGIVAGGTFIQISTIYEDMIQKQGSSELESEAKLIVEQLTARLGSSVKNSLVGATGLDGSGCYILNTVDINTSRNEKALWIGISNESNQGLWDATTTINDYRGWSGFTDITASDTTTYGYISTKGSRLDFAEKVIDDLIGKTNSLSLAEPQAAIYFLRQSDLSLNQQPTACTDFGFTNTNAPPELMFKIYWDGTDNSRLYFQGNRPNVISDRYVISHYAYAIELKNSTLYLYSFRPWLSEKASAPYQTNILGQHVNEVVIQRYNGLIRINVCVKKTMPGGYDIQVCKEKMIF
jgi:prepilin-type N-terminal cleavage/methylation domain-containing protein